MATIHESVSTVNFDAALLAAAARAKAAYPAERCRIERGVGIVLSHGVDILPTGIALVQSQSQPGVQYTVNGRCGCPDEQRAPGGRCKHMWAKALAKRAHEACAHPGVPITTLRHGYHMASGEEGHARILSDGRVAFYPGGHKYSFVCVADEVCLGPPLDSNGRPY